MSSESNTIDFGIDLGTTNSSIALCRRGEVRVFQSAELMNVTPSVVYVSKAGRLLVGKRAYDTWVADPQNAQAQFKRWMGFSDELNFPSSGKQFSAEELSAEVLKTLRADAQRQTGESVDAAVITVPAAFGSLQCDATARAARRAGFVESPLLQEPIAAAIAYGAAPASRDQRWMVFDLGGGTLDIAIVSTRNDRLAILEHEGNNRLGGKDIDEAIAEAFLLAPLAQTFRLPEDAERQRLMRALIRQAELAKIALSSAEETIVELFDLGEDLDGKPIEATITIKRSEMESKVAPIFDRCLEQVKRALERARLEPKDLDRVLLVGGPTQMPMLRSAITDALGAKLDYSLDPMTVVAHGAALYASTIERTTPSATPTPSPKPASDSAKAVPIQLAYERASGSPQSPVAGIVESADAIAEIKIDAAGGFWSSGWIAVAHGAFQTEVTLNPAKPVTHFTLAARDRSGNAVAVAPNEFSITSMLPMAAAPLPHTIAIELSTLHGVTTFDPIFKRHCPLPAEAKKIYKADRTLRPSETDATLPIKFWEIDVSEDPQEKWWAGCVHVRAERIKRPIPEGTEMSLTVKIDASRKISVQLYIPLLNQSFSDDVFIPDPPSARSKVDQELGLCFERIAHVRTEIYEADRTDLAPLLDTIELRAEAIAEQIETHKQRVGSLDPDATLGPVDALRKLRVQITQIEDQLQIGAETPTLSRRMRWQVRHVERVVLEHGTSTEQAEFSKLQDQYQRCTEGGDVRGLKWVQDQLWELHFHIVKDKMWYWQNRLAILKTPGRSFINKDQAASHIAQAEAANAKGDMAALRSAVNKAWALLPPDQVESAQEQAAQSGLRAQ
jgi:molecular chaperone DnaK